MSFMEREVFRGAYYAVDADHGSTYIVPVTVSGRVATNGELQDYVEGTIDRPDDEPTVRHGWLARLTAPGYLDCTDWSAHPTEQDAVAYLDEMYGDDEPDDDDELNG